MNKNIELNTIYEESCLETLKRMRDNSVGVVITSPPYNMNLRINKGRYTSRQIVKEISTKYSEFSDNIPIDEYNAFHTKVLKELIRVSDLVFYNIQIVTGSKRSVFKMIGEFSDFLKDIIIWDKGNGQPAMQKQVLNKRSELILVFEKDYPISRQFMKRGYFQRGTLDDLWEISRERNTSNSEHGAVFPQELVKKILINFSVENDIVYDPFMGTGTTAVVASKLNRKFIGSEISRKYIEIAKGRLKNTQMEIL
jgi:site-specific DNA-methyltransferase (adenine-specific)